MSEQPTTVLMINGYDPARVKPISLAELLRAEIGLSLREAHAAIVLITNGGTFETRVSFERATELIDQVTDLGFGATIENA